MNTSGRRILFVLVVVALLFVTYRHYIVGYSVQFMINYGTGETETRLLRGNKELFVMERTDAVPFARKRPWKDDWRLSHEWHLDIFVFLRRGCHSSIAYGSIIQLRMLANYVDDFEEAQALSEEFLRILYHEGDLSADSFVRAHIGTQMEVYLNADHLDKENAARLDYSPSRQTPPSTDTMGSAARDGLVAGSNWDLSDLSMNLVWVNSGLFEIGSRDGSITERPVSVVRIERGYWMGMTEVTQAQYEALTGDNPSFFKGEDLPVEQVNWHDAMRFCELLTELERKNGRMPEGYVFRLPTEWEWEYAARGGREGRNVIYSGSNTLDEVAWYWDNSDRKTHPVGTKAANELGLHDMSGNVWEWVYDERYPGARLSSLRTDSVRMLRGGCWRYPASYSRVTVRNSRSSMVKYSNLGFRVVLGPPL